MTTMEMNYNKERLENARLTYSSMTEVRCSSLQISCRSKDILKMLSIIYLVFIVHLMKRKRTAFFTVLNNTGTLEV